jgi:hypothetical protein
MKNKIKNLIFTILIFLLLNGCSIYFLRHPIIQ